MIRRYLIFLCLASTLFSVAVPTFAEVVTVKERDRVTVRLDGWWEFAVDPQGTAPREAWAKALPSPGRVTLPHRWAGDPQLSATRTSTVWYARSVVVPPAAQAAAGVALILQCPVGECEVYWDGKLTDHFLGNGLPHRLVVSGLPESEHQLALRLTATRLPASTCPIISCGIGPIAIQVLPAVRIDAVVPSFADGGNRVIVTYRLSADAPRAATLNLSLLPLNSRHPVKRWERIPISLPVGTLSGTVTLRGKSLRRWSITSCHRYVLRAELRADDNSAQDSYQMVCGVANLTLDHGKHLLLNGQPIVLKGMRLPGGLLGGRTASLRELLEHDLSSLRQAGFNAIMCDGAAFPEEVLNVADRLGMLVVMDVPPTFANEASDGTALRPDIVTAIEEFGHHPSIVAWSWERPERSSIELNQLRQLDRTRPALVRYQTGSLWFQAVLTSGEPILCPDAFVTNDLATASTVIRAAVTTNQPVLLLGTPAMSPQGDATREARDRHEALIQGIVESVRHGNNPLGYFVRTATDDTWTGLESADRDAWTSAFYSALHYNSPSMIALDVQEGTRPTASAWLINEKSFKGTYQLYCLLTTPDGGTELRQLGNEDGIEISGDTVQCLATAMHVIAAPKPGTYQIQFVLSQRGKVRALSRVVSFTASP